MTRRISGTTILLVGIILLAGAGVALAATGFFDVPTTGSITLQANDGPAATVSGGPDMNFSQAYPDDNTVQWFTASGNITFSSAGPTNVTVAKSEITGTWTNLTGLDVAAHDLTADPEDKAAFVVGGDAEAFSMRQNPAIDDGTVDFVYSGTTGSTTVEISGLQANTLVGAVDTNTTTLLDSATTTANGVVTLSMPNSDHTVELQTSSGEPTISNRRPSDSYKLSNDGIEINATVDDPDFPSDSVNATIQYKPPTANSYTNASTTTLENSGEANATLSGLLGGVYEWRVVATDGYGQTNVSSNFEFEVPRNVTIFDEENPNQKINTATVELRFFTGDDEQVFERSTTDGTLNLTGLPVNQDFVIVSRTGGYRPRPIWIENIYSQQEIYLLNDSTAADSLVFQLNDQTGEFPSGETLLQIKKPINKDFNGDGSNTTEFQTIVADFFGASSELAADLVSDTRYRLQIRNDGQIKELGKYTTSGDAAVPLEVEDINTTLSDANGLQYNVTFVNSSSPSVRVELADPETQTENIDVRIYERGNRSSPLYQNSFDGPIGSLTVREPVSSVSADNHTYAVEISAERNGETIDVTEVVGKNQNLQLQSMPWWLQQFIALMTILVVAGLGSQANAQITAVITALTGGLFYFIGFLPAAMSGGVVILAILVSTAFYMRGQGRPV